jgi:hypothetical protein
MQKLERKHMKTVYSDMNCIFMILYVLTFIDDNQSFLPLYKLTGAVTADKLYSEGSGVP